MKAEAQSFAQIVENDKYLVIPFFNGAMYGGRTIGRNSLKIFLETTSTFLVQ